MRGVHCAIGQRGSVWFLASGYGSAKIKRTCRMPAAKTLFFPIINTIYMSSKTDHRDTCDQAKRRAALNNETAVDLFAELNGVPFESLNQRRIRTIECFDANARIDPEQRSYQAYPSATDGFWLMLKPLSVGRHTLKFGARYNRSSGREGQMMQDIEYELIIE